jgi:hypothetical protein
MQFESIFRCYINGSPTQIEVSPGLTSEKGPIPGGVLRFVEDGEELFCVALDEGDMDSLVGMLCAALKPGKASEGGDK